MGGVSYLDGLLIAVSSLHLLKAPFTKVEESFNIQAIHDILNYGVFDVSKYDHIQFPGAVPRTFTSALIVASLVKPVVLLKSLFEAPQSTQIETQLMVRGTIGLLNCLSIIYLRNALQECLAATETETRDNNKTPETKAEGEGVGGEEEEEEEVRNNSFSFAGTWFILFVVASFHLMFYSTRTLPNFIITFSLTNIALAWTLKQINHWAIFLLAVTAIIFRLEVAALGSGIALFSVLSHRITLPRAIKFGVYGIGIGMGISLTIDSYFWGTWVVPEVNAFIFNVMMGNSAMWGTEPALAYLYKYLPIIFFPQTVILLNHLGLKLAPTNLKIVAFASYFHIAVLSLQPHKEWRFIVYSIPAIMVVGAVGAAHLWENLRTRYYPLVYLLPLSPLISFCISMLFLFISGMNYPGGDALMKLNDYIVENNITNVTVHASVPACMTGITLFGSLDYSKYGVTYDKTENYTQLRALWPSYDYLITIESSSDRLPFENKNGTANWELIQRTPMFVGLNYTYLGGLASEASGDFPRFVSDLASKGSVMDALYEILDDALIKEDVLFTYERKRERERTV